jgi:predicted nuclease of predicted toxin-antitoxin system
LGKLLRNEFKDIRHVIEFDLTQSDDRRIWEFARQHRFTIVTRDRDFFERALLLGPPPKIVWLRLGNAMTSGFADLLLQSKMALEAFESDPQAAFLALPPGFRI